MLNLLRIFHEQHKPGMERGDWQPFLGWMTNNLIINLLTMMGLLIFVVVIPTEIVYGRIAPAFGLAVLVASVCYAWFTW